MYNSKLYELFNTLNESEKRNLKKWVRSPFANQKTEIILLFDFLLSRKAYSLTTLNRYKVWSFVFPDEKFEDTKFRLLCSQSLKTLENLLLYLFQQKKSIEQKLALSEIYQEKQLKNTAASYLTEVEDKLKEKAQSNGELFLEQYHFQLAKFKFDGTEARDQSTNLESILHHLNDFYIFEFLKHACSIISHQNVSNQRYIIPQFDIVMNYLENDKEQLKPSIFIYYNALLSLKNPTEIGHFNNLKTGLKTYATHFNNNELKDLHLIAINFCIKSLNSGNKERLNDLFEFYQSALQLKLFIEHNELSRFTFRNIISCALQLNEYVWIEAFIEKYAPFLNEKYRQNQVNFNLARLYFAKGLFEKTTPILLQEDFGDPLLNLAAKTMLVKIYFELKEWAILDATLDSFSVFLNRQKQLAYHRLNYKNFIHFMKKMVRLNHDKLNLKKLEADIIATNPLTEKKWLLNAITDLKN